MTKNNFGAFFKLSIFTVIDFIFDAIIGLSIFIILAVFGHFLGPYIGLPLGFLLYIIICYFYLKKERALRIN